MLSASELIPIFQALSSFTTLKALSFEADTQKESDAIPAEIVKALESNNQLSDFTFRLTSCPLKIII
jgi:hypothetical protein